MTKVLDFGIDRDDLCERLGGGLPKGGIVVLEGKFGAGKSILCERMTYGLVDHKHSVSYVSTERTTAGFLKQMESLEYDLQAALMSEQLVFIPVHPLLGARAPRDELLQRIAKARRMYSKDVVMFDTFSKFLHDHLAANGHGFDAMEQIEGVLYLFKRLASQGRTLILTFETGQVDEDVARTFKEAADVYIEIKMEQTGASTNRQIVVHRMSRAAGRFGEVIGFRVEPGLGIVIEIKSVV